MSCIIKILLLCIILTVSITCRKETCVILDKHTYTIEKEGGSWFFKCYYYERDKKSKYYKQQTLQLSTSLYSEQSYSKDKPVQFSRSCVVYFENTIDVDINLTYRVNGVTNTVTIDMKKTLFEYISDYPKDAELQILKVEYL